MEQTYSTEYRIGMDYGVGVNSVTGHVAGPGVDPGKVEPIQNAGGQDVNTDLTIINTQDEFQKALDISASVNGQYGLFSGNAKFDFSSRIGYQAESTFMVARVVVKNAFTQASRPQLRPEIAKLIEQGKWDRVREQVGDVFVRGFETGGEFYGVIEISSSVRTAQKKIAASLQAKYGVPLAGVEVNAQMSLSEEEKHAETRIVVNVFQNGGKGNESISDADTMLARYKEFPALVSAENARPIRALLASYRTLDLPTEPNFIDVNNRIAVLQERVSELNTVLELRNKVKYILAHPEYYIQPDINELNDASVALATLANTITRGASECANDSNKCQFAAFVLPKFVIPQRVVDAPPPPVATKVPERPALSPAFQKILVKRVEVTAQAARFAVSR